jgi:hypothetical protein
MGSLLSSSVSDRDRIGAKFSLRELHEIHHKFKHQFSEQLKSPNPQNNSLISYNMKVTNILV